MKRILRSLLIVLLSAGAVYAAGSWATNNWTYKPQLTTQGTTDYTQFNLSQDKIDTEMQRVRNLLSTSVKTPQMYGAVADGTTDDTTAIQAAATAAGGKVLYFPPATGYKVTAAITLSVANTIVMGDDKTPITQATAATNLFTVSASGIEFRNLKLVGSDTGDGTTDLQEIYGIGVAGSSAAPLSGIKITNCDISGFFYGIRASWTSVDIDSNNVYNVMKGIDTANPYDDRAVDSTALRQTITNNRCVSSWGKVASCRPINCGSYLGSLDVVNNYCRGGAIAIENYTDYTLVSVPPRVKIIGNDCDTGISSGGTHICYNTIDYGQIPAGRGYMSDYGYGIENLMPGQIIQGNILRHQLAGIIVQFPNCRVVDNYFYHCGYHAGYPAPPAVTTYGSLFVVAIDSNGLNDSVYMNTHVSGNTFDSTQSDFGTQDIPDITISAGVSAGIYGVVVDNNISKNCMVNFIGSYKAYGCTVSNNYIIDSNTADNTAAAWAMIETDNSCTINYYGNTVVNTLGGTGFGPAWGIVPYSGSTVGTNRFTGMRTGGASFGNFPKVTGYQIVDGVGVLPGPYANSAAAAGAGYSVGTMFYVAVTGALGVVIP